MNVLGDDGAYRIRTVTEFGYAYDVEYYPVAGHGNPELHLMDNMNKDDPQSAAYLEQSKKEGIIITSTASSFGPGGLYAFGAKKAGRILGGGLSILSGLSNGHDALNTGSAVDGVQAGIDGASVVSHPYLSPVYTGVNNIIELNQDSEDD